MEYKTVFKASISGSVEAKDPKDQEAYIVTVVYDDGSRSDLQKTYEQFIELQGKVYNLLKQKGGYSRKTSRTLISSLPENNSPLSRILFKDDDVKKMMKVQEFLKELLTLPKVVTESQEVLEFFGSSNTAQVPNDRLEQEEKLKRINKVAELLSGRDPLRQIPEKSPTYNNSSWKPEDLHRLSDESRENLYQRLNRLQTRRPSKEIPSLPSGKRRPASTDDEVETRKPQRPGLSRRAFSVAVGVADLMKENAEIDTDKSPDATHIKRKAATGKESNDSVTKESTELEKIRKISSQFGVRVGRGRGETKTMYVALSLITAEEEGEVSLKEGDTVEVLQKESSGWWYVKNGICEGWAPASFLTPASPRSTSPIESNEQSSCKIQDQLDSCPDITPSKEARESSTTRSLGHSTERVNQAKTADMNRRVKFLAVEGIQKRKNPDKNYVYILKVVWSDGTINIIYRKCSDFFFLQENLRREFPNSLGKEIPVLKGRKFTENCHFCFKDGTCKRRQFMNQFCHELINAPDNISTGNAVMTFCRPTDSDILPHDKSDKSEGKKKETTADEENVPISGPVVFEQYVVIADYKKKNKNDITLTAGDIVDVIERNDYGWWLVDNDGELGWAPASYLEPTDDGSEITTKKSFAPGKEEMYVSAKSYESQASDEISFDVGVVIEVIEKTLDGWWYVRYLNQEGWAPAMFLRKMESGDASSSPIGGRMDTLDIVSFNGESDDKDGFSRTPPTRRSMVKRTIRKKPKRNSSSDDKKENEAEESKSNRSISVPAANQPIKHSPRSPLSPRGMPSPRPSSRPHSREITADDIDSLLKLKHMSTTSSGYESSPHGSMSSLTSSEVFNEDLSNDVLKKSSTLPRFEDIPHTGSSPVIPRSHSTTSMAHYMQELQLSASGSPYISKRSLEQNIKSSSVSNLPRKTSPVPAPRKISRGTPLTGSPKVSPRGPTSQSKDAEQFNSENDYDNQSGSDSPPDYESTESGVEIKQRTSLQRGRKGVAKNTYGDRSSEEEEATNWQDRIENSRLYRAQYSYLSTEEGEVSFNAGDEIEVIKRNDSGWWLVRTSNELGWGPSNFLTAF